jgi:hypothetical protein
MIDWIKRIFSADLKREYLRSKCDEPTLKICDKLEDHCLKEGALTILSSASGNLFLVHLHENLYFVWGSTSSRKYLNFWLIPSIDHLIERDSMIGCKGFYTRTVYEEAYLKFIFKKMSLKGRFMESYEVAKATEETKRLDKQRWDAIDYISDME